MVLNPALTAAVPGSRRAADTAPRMNPAVNIRVTVPVVSTRNRMPSGSWEVTAHVRSPSMPDSSR